MQEGSSAQPLVFLASRSTKFLYEEVALVAFLLTILNFLRMYTW